MRFRILRALTAPRDGKRFKALLIMIFVVVLLMPLGSKRVLGRHTLELVFYVMLLSAVYAVGTTKSRRILSLALVAAAIGSSLLDFQLLSDILSIVFLVYCCEQVLAYVLSDGPVTTDKLLASLCVYMLMALMFGEVYTTFEQTHPGSFTNLDAREERALALPIMTELGYFSFVTQTTLGYGDIAPKGAFVRTIASLQAVLGQLFLAVLVARLVALQIATRITTTIEADDEERQSD